MPPRKRILKRSIKLETMSKLIILLQDFEKATKRFEEILKEEKTDITRDSAIKRFELAFDLAWKTVKAFLEDYHNVQCVSPKTCFREAFNKGLVEYNDYWISVSSLRNYTVHTYNEIFADEMYKKLPKALEYFKTLLEAIKKASL